MGEQKTGYLAQNDAINFTNRMENGLNCTNPESIASGYNQA
jgi:hypothetical protein